MKDEIRELTADDFARALPRRVRERLVRGEFQSGDVALLRRFTGLSQEMFARALGISVHTLATGSRGGVYQRGRRWRCCGSLPGTRESCARTWPWQATGNGAHPDL